MNRLEKFIVGTLIFFASTNTWSMDVLLEGGFNTDSPAYQALQGNGAKSYSPLPGVAFAGTAMFPLSPGFGIETGTMYLYRRFGVAESAIPDVSVEEGYGSLLLPVVLRWQPGAFISLGLGPYYMIGIGKIAVTRTLAGVTGSTVFQEFGRDDGISQGGFGVMAGVRFISPVSSDLGLVVDARYLKDLSQRYVGSDASLYFHDFQVLAGVGIHL